jgi:sigma-E factor negative regulatory protein RseC
MKNIEHEGVVEKVSGNHFTVKIISQSACASCHAKGACTVADEQEKEVEVVSMQSFKPGDHVVVSGSSSQGLKAAWWAYILPVVLILSTLIIAFSLTQNENLAALLSLLVLVPYFLIIHMADSVMKKTFTFTIQSKNE